MKEQNHPKVIKIRNAHVHNLKHIDVDIPLNKITGIAGVSGSGKSSLALGVLYAEGSRRYPDALSTYTRRRMTQAPRAQVDEVLHIPAALAFYCVVNCILQILFSSYRISLSFNQSSVIKIRSISISSPCRFYFVL